MELCCRKSILSLFTIYYFVSVMHAQPAVTVRRPVIETLTNKDIVLECSITGITIDENTNDIIRWASPGGTFFVISNHINGPFGDQQHRRYSFNVTGNNYNLIISQVQPTDDGPYRCIYGGLDPPIYKDVIVRVFVEPGRPKIAGLGSVVIDPISVGREIERVTIPYGTTSAQIKCTVGPSKPAIPIKWYMAAEELTSNVSPTETMTDDDGLDTTSSILTVEINEPRYWLNNAVYKCVADLRAVNLSVVQGRSLPERKFNLSAQFPPGDPSIEGFQDTILKPGDVAVLVCKTISGNPLPTIQWYRNGEPYLHEFRTVEVSTTVSSEVRIDIQPSDNNAVYRCDAKNAAISTPRSTSVTFRVQFPPAEVTITGNDPVKAGESIVLSCTTSNSNPSARIVWTRYGTILNTSDDDTTITASENGGFITQTNLTVTPNRNDRDTRYTCQASELVSRSVNLDVLYPPDSITITGHNSSKAVLLDTSLKLRCSTRDGNPPPDLSWYTGPTKRIFGVGDLMTLGTTRYRDLSLVAEPKHNGAIFRCTASSAASSTAMETSVSATVHFPPQNVTITITPERAMKENVEVTLRCDSGSSNPSSTIKWRKNDTDVLDSVQSLGERDAEFGGKATVSSYTFTPRASDNGLVVLCSARNELIARSTTQGISLNVLHTAIFSGVPLVLTVQEGKNLSGNFSAIANPAAITYTWFKVEDDTETQLTFAAKRDGTPAELSVVDGILHLTNINRNKAGKYRVKGTNSEGPKSADFEIDVLYAAGIPSAPTQSYEDETSLLKLHCVIDANPPIDENQARWTRLNYDMARATSTVTGTGNSRTLILAISNVVLEDIGMFTCEANNTYGSASKEYTVATVPFSPVIDRAPITSKSAAQTHTDGVIKCNLEAFPKPSITWRKGESVISLNDDKYSMIENHQGEKKFSFQLTIKGIINSDYGVYICNAANKKGSDSHEIILRGTSKPDPPTDLQTMNVSDSFVTLTWQPAFDGGLPQTFNIRHHILASGNTNYKYADASTIPYTVTGLEPATEYKFSVQAFNKLGVSGYATSTVSATTLVAPTPKAIILKPDEPMFIVIMALAVVGGLFLIVTTVLVCIFVRRRRRRKSSEDSASQSNTEMYDTHDSSNFHDDAKSYSTYDKGLDEDFAKHYENDNDVNLAKAAITNDTYVSHQPWAKTEDPDGNYGVYLKQQQNMLSETSENEQYTRELRDLTKSMHPQLEGYQRPAFAANRPPAPPPPGVQLNRLPPLPERNYSPNLDYLPPVQGGMQYHHASFGRSTPSVESTDDMRGHLV